MLLSFLFYVNKNGRYACHMILMRVIHADNFPFMQ